MKGLKYVQFLSKHAINLFDLKKEKKKKRKELTHAINLFDLKKEKKKRKELTQRTKKLYPHCNSLTQVLNNNNVHLSCAHQRLERSYDTY